MNDELIRWSEEPAQTDAAPLAEQSPWKVLIVDDDPEVHGVTRFALQHLRVFGRPLRLLHAASGQAARGILQQHPDIAVALLDVVMETTRAGLDLVGYIRDELGMMECRLILRTGEPGYAPELTVIEEYDINDYRTKAELNRTRLITTVSAALRSYQQLCTIAEQRQGLEMVVRAAAELKEERAIAYFAEGVLTQLAALLRLPVDGIVCSQKELALGDGKECGYVIAAAAGCHARYIAQPLARLPDKRIVEAITNALTNRQHIFAKDYTVLYLQAAPEQEAAVFLDSCHVLESLDRTLLDIFVNSIAACFRNVKLIERLLAVQHEDQAQREFLRAVIDANPHLTFVVDSNGLITLANQNFAATVGHALEEVVDQPLANFLSDPQLLQSFAEDEQDILSGRRPRVEREVAIANSAGEVRWFHTIKAPIRAVSSNVEQLICVGIDTTERKRAELALFEAKERAQVTLHSIGDAVITADAQAKVDYLNPVAEALTGWSMAEARGRPIDEIFRVISGQTREAIAEPLNQCIRSGRMISLTTGSILVSRDGREFDIDDSAAPIRGHDGVIMGGVLVFRDVSETRQLERQLAYDATHDALTGLCNRAEFERRLQAAVDSSRRSGSRHVLSYLDLDRFRVINDTAGHTAGDELLKQIRGVLTGVFRESDVLARVGGDEFALLQENCPLERAVLVAQSVVSLLRAHRFAWGGRSYQISASIGLVPISADTESTVQLMTHADVACYAAKELGRNRVHVYQEADLDTLRRHHEIIGAAGLRDALDQGMFRLHYQPIVALDGQDFRTLGHEVLLRVVHGRVHPRIDELVLPAVFIPAAERYGLMAAIDRWVIQTAFHDYVKGIGRTETSLAINVSGNSLSDDGLLDFIEQQFTATGFPPERVCFEITETAAIQNLRPAMALLTALKRHGCQLALDDFGSGLSSFHYLKSLPIDHLKIDGSFVKDMRESARDDALVAAINDMGHALGLRIVAEYVSSKAIVDRLSELGVDYGQGFFFGKPAPWTAES